MSSSSTARILTAGMATRQMVCQRRHPHRIERWKAIQGQHVPDLQRILLQFHPQGRYQTSQSQQRHPISQRTASRRRLDGARLPGRRLGSRRREIGLGKPYEERLRGRNVMKTPDEGWKVAKPIMHRGDWNSYRNPGRRRSHSSHAERSGHAGSARPRRCGRHHRPAIARRPEMRVEFRNLKLKRLP